MAGISAIALIPFDIRNLKKSFSFLNLNTGGTFVYLLTIAAYTVSCVIL